MKIEYKEIYQTASGSYLTECVPYNFLDLEDWEQDEFIQDHQWEVVENYGCCEVAGWIASSADAVVRLLEGNGIEVIK